MQVTRKGSIVRSLRNWVGDIASWTVVRTSTSLRLQTRRELRGLAAGSVSLRARRRVQRISDFVGRRVPPAVLPVATLLLAVGGLFIPGPAWLSALEQSDAATSYLESLWQVVGAVAGLSITVVFFALQTLTSARGSAVRDAGLVGRFQSAIYLSIASLVTIGFALLGLGHDAPAGWSAAWAVCVAGVAVVSIAALIAGLAAILSPAFLQRRRLATISRQADAHVDLEARDRVALSLLDAAQSPVGFEWSPFERDGGNCTAASKEAGVVVDIRLGTLRRLVSRAAERRSLPVRVAVRIGNDVRAGQALVFLGSDDPDLAPLARRVVKLAPTPRAGRDADLHTLADELHAEAIRAIRDARLTEYESIAEAQRALVLAVPKAWKERYGQQFTHDLAAGLSLFQFGPIDRVARNMYEQMRVSIDVGVRELALKVAYEPLYVVSRAVHLGATGLAKQMLETAGSMATVSVVDETSELVREHAWLNFQTTMQSSVEPVVENEDLSEGDRRAASSLVMVGLDVMARIGRHAIATRDVEHFNEIDRAWNRVHDFWLEDHAAEYNPPTITRELAAEIQEARDRCQVAVAIWLLAELRRNPSDTKLREMHRVLRLRKVSVQTILAHQEYESDDLISRWVLEELPSGEAHVIDSIGPRLAALAFMLVDASRDAEQSLRPSRWLLDNREGLLAAIEHVPLEEPSAMILELPGPTLASAAERAGRAVSAAAAEQADADDDALRNSQVSGDQQAHFQQLVSEMWNQSHALRQLLTSTGLRVVSEEGTPPETQLRIAPILDSKIWIVEGRGGFGFDQLARQVAKSLTQGESRRMLDSLGLNTDITNRRPSEEAPSADAVLLRLREAVSDLRDGGFEATLIMCGWVSDVIRQIEIAPLADAERSAFSDKIVGRWEGVPITRPGVIRSAPFLVLDSTAWAQIREWGSPGSVIRTGLTTFDSTTGRAYLESHPEVFADLDSLEDRLLELQRRMLIEASAAVEFVVLDAAAARVVEAPPPTG
jgi:hypothetical protein